MKFILGKKIEMTQKLKEDGTVVPVTVIKAGPCYITQIKDKTKDGYRAIQIGYQLAKKLNKPLAGHLKGKFQAKYLRELRVDDSEKQDFAIGQIINVDIFQVGDKIMVSGISKGKGFQGVVKRHGFHGHNTTHGTKDQVRHPGAIGAGGPQHVFKGMRMAGRMGGEKITVLNLEVIEVDPTNNLIYIKGAVPGARNTLIEILAPGEMVLKSGIKPATEGKKEETEVSESVSLEQPVEKEAEIK
jgi:large subunit ribosomal protein L3